MSPLVVNDQALVPSPAYHRAQARLGPALHINTLTLVSVLHRLPPAHLLLEWAMLLYQIRPRVIRWDAAYWRLHLITWIHAILQAVAVIPWNPKRQKNRSCLPPTWTITITRP